MRGAWIETLVDCRHVAGHGSLPVRGAWIETTQLSPSAMSVKSLPVRGAWIETYFCSADLGRCLSSLPVRGAWIETALRRCGRRNASVAPREGGVD